MADYRTIPAAELGKGSNIKVELCETEVDLYWKMAIEVLELIQENNAKGEKTVMIVPYGPLGPYARLVELINKHRVSLKNCWFINMDEYLDENKQYLPKTDPLSFRGGMDRIFYGLVDPELLMPEEQRIFPEPGNEGRIWETIQKLGKLDMCWGGVGITGHIAFNGLFRRQRGRLRRRGRASGLGDSGRNNRSVSFGRGRTDAAGRAPAILWRVPGV